MNRDESHPIFLVIIGLIFGGVGAWFLFQSGQAPAMALIRR